MNKPLDLSQFSEEIIDHIAEKAADKAVKKMTDSIYKEVGKSVVSRFFTIVGVLTLVAYFWAQARGWLK